MPSVKRLLLALTAVAAVCAFASSSAFASSKQVTIMQDNNVINANPLAALTKMKAMGVTMVKYAVYWQYFTPAAGQRSTKIPTGFNPTDPSSYNGEFNLLDEIDQDAQKVGIKVGFMVTAPIPRWAESSTKNCASYSISSAFTCRPNDAYFKTFMTALGERYNGSVAGIPAVRWWSIWNEPNYIPNLAPQLVGSTTYEAADLYRGLIDSAWSGLAASGHKPGKDTILFGEVAPRGIEGTKAFNTSGSKPVAFVDALYCQSTTHKRFTGKLAKANGCATSNSAFRKAHPALFSASGFADHPYSQGVPPNQKTGDCRIGGQGSFCQLRNGLKADPLWTDLASIGNLTGALSKDTKAWGATKNYAIWNTEYGFWTSPPSSIPCKTVYSSACALSQANAAYYANWAEYLMYKNSRIASFAQYQLVDPPGHPKGWTDGLFTHAGKAKAAFAAYEMPLYMPTTTRSGNLTVWGGVKPAAYDKAHYGAKPSVRIQFKAKSGGWKTVKTVSVSTTKPGSYFTTTAKFPGAGSVRLAYLVGKTTLVSRTQVIK